MKKTLSLLLIFALLLSFAACGKEKTVLQNNIEEPVDLSQINFNMLPLDDPVYEAVSRGIPSIEKFIEYNHILGNTIDYTSVSSEDFWNIVAITVASYSGIDEYASVDVTGAYHMKWNTMLEFADAFMYDTIFKHSVPSYKTSYAASADPGTGVIDLIPLGVDNYDASLEGIELAESNEYDYIVHIALAGRESDTYIHHYSVYLADWARYIKEYYDVEDAGGHIFPYMIVGYKLDYSVDTEVYGAGEEETTEPAISDSAKATGHID